jgi:putative FmdB family regulatory protein
MPIYEYQCEECGHEFEREQRITEKPLKTCVSCGGRKARRLISRTSFVLKGGGWYSDLYSGKKQDAAPKESKGAGGAEESAKPSKAKEATDSLGGAKESADSAKPSKSSKGPSARSAA